MIAVPDGASVAAMLWLESRLGRRVGPSTGTNLIGALALMQEIEDARRPGSVATLICDPGERYAQTAYDPEWRKAQRLDTAEWDEAFARFERTGRFDARLASHAKGDAA